MKITFAIILVSMFVAWLIYLAGNRTGKLAVLLWFPFTAMAAIGSLSFLIAIAGLLLASRMHDATDGFAALGGLIISAFSLPAPIFLIISIRKRPLGLAFGSQPLHIHLVDINEKPIRDASIYYASYPYANFTSTLKGDVRTSISGKAILYTRRQTKIEVIVQKSGFKTVRFEVQGINASGLRNFIVDMRTLKIPNGKKLNLKVYMVTEGSDTRPPYPPEKSVWK